MADRFAEALSELRDELLSGGPALSVIEAIAADYELPLAALENRARIAFGDIETYAERRAAETAATAAQSAKRRADLEARAIREHQTIVEFFRLHPTAFR